MGVEKNLVFWRWPLVELSAYESVRWESYHCLDADLSLWKWAEKAWNQTCKPKTCQKWQKSQVPHKNQIFLFGQDNKICRVFDFSISKLWGHFSSLQSGKSNSTAILDFYFMPGVQGEFCHWTSLMGDVTSKLVEWLGREWGWYWWNCLQCLMVWILLVRIYLLFLSRWDIQHMRAIQAHQNLEKKSRDREEARLKGKRTGCKSDCEKSVESFLPCPEEGMLRLS